MGDFTEDMRSRLPSGMVLPEPFAALFDWIERRGLLHPSEAVKGDRFGSLQPLGDPPYQGTVLLFRVETQEQATRTARWLGRNVDGPAIARRLVPFARVGGDGSEAAFWIDDAGAQRIVHLGSEGRACVLGQTPLDFLRLCAIGYEAISEDMMEAPDRPPGPDCTPNKPFVDWLTSTYGVTIPATASEIIGTPPPVFGPTDRPDPFWRWTRANSGN